VDFETGPRVTGEREVPLSPGICRVPGDLSSPPGPPAASSEAPAALSASPRASLLARLAGELAALTTAGDLEAARVVNETIGRLLARPAGEHAAVVDLAAEREKRGR
jgi:hypothetical protein